MPSAGPVRPTDRSSAALRPDASAVLTGDGLLGQRRAVNASVSIPQGPERLEEAGNLENLRAAARKESGEAFRGGYPFQDSDVHKWLEAAAWQLGDDSTATDPGLPDRVQEIVGLLRGAQDDAGYLNSYFMLAKPDQPRFTELVWGHELYTAGHLIQAAVAHHRATGRGELLDIAVKFADLIDASFGPEGSGKPIDRIDGHPEIETALAELYRETGERRYLDLAGYFVDAHGRGTLGSDTNHHMRLGYFQDHAPVREAKAVTGHSVRQLYLLAGATDVATETGDAELRAAVERLWAEMAARQTYLTGGVGAHHSDEAFGHPYELPNERAYCETCAAIASVQWSWRMALLTGDTRYSDLLERTLLNGVLCGVSLGGDRYLYDNPLHVRDGFADQEGAGGSHGEGDDGGGRRVGWFRCACCPPNVMRLLASLPSYVASTDADGLQLHQYAEGTVAGGGLALEVATRYPWEGRIALTVREASAGERTLSLRIPHWAREWTADVNGQAGAGIDGARSASPEGRGRETGGRDGGWLRITREWAAGDEVVLDLAMAPRLTEADPRVDAARGCAAIERGPLVYCVEAGDQPELGDGYGLDDLVLDVAAGLAAEWRPKLLDGVCVVTATARVRGRSGNAGWWPYGDVDAASGEVGEAVTLTAVPYYAWANRGVGAMRVWIPRV
ncbi:glycosyl hydrolase [Mangrovactinospora gilvigrisea]|uniref:Glycosyl hydrolase n=1 Tax=Mangrovactinospora gilvigrisea TaxID=1428644 RepID=A0A1J7BS75_9ACTN|nr:beta-L-arabinofuranosidase domain-containing protein [Mangrovactinospora gilvigrisea]OIV36313.1 glycosyl hydrolase [Mangrovactinospora gilvigrisea]